MLERIALTSGNVHALTTATASVKKSKIVRTVKSKDNALTRQQVSIRNADSEKTRSRQGVLKHSGNLAVIPGHDTYITLY